MLQKLYSDRDQYFQQPQEEKDKNKDPNNHNLGYVLVKNIREYIKVCNTSFFIYSFLQLASYY